MEAVTRAGEEEQADVEDEEGEKEDGTDETDEDKNSSLNGKVMSPRLRIQFLM